jgi:hypothetical protein
LEKRRPAASVRCFYCLEAERHKEVAVSRDTLSTVEKQGLKMQGASMGSEESKQIFKDVIVAVHGIGQQSRYSTVRSVATRLASSKTLLESIPALAYAPVALQPLGYFHGESDTVTSVSLLDDAMILGNAPLASTGFAEVFWADIPAEVVKKGSTLEETKAWAHTVVARAQALWIRSKNKGIIPPDFGLATEVLGTDVRCAPLAIVP